MTRVGRNKGGRGVYIPSNNFMQGRASKQLEAHAVAQAEKHRVALQIDGPRFAFWRKLSGSIPCSCSAHRDSSNLHSSVEPGEKNATSAVAVGKKNTTGRRGVRYVGNQAGEGTYFDENDLEENKLDKLTDRNTKKVHKTGDFPDEDDILDILDAGGNTDLAGKEPSLMDFDDPFNIFGGKIIDCPICFGEAYQDAWQLHNGLRIVLDTTNAYHFDGKSYEVENDGPGPSIVKLLPKGENYWTLKFPLYFNEVIRVRLYKGMDVIDTDLYSLEYITENNDTGIVDPTDLMVLNGVDEDVTIQLKNLTDKELDFTHAEIIFNFAPFEHCQLPDIEMAYEQQFLDWNVSTNVEVPAGMAIKEGDYLNDEKYKRVWKINSINRRITAGGNEFGTSLDVRVLHSFEKLFTVLEIF